LVQVGSAWVFPWVPDKIPIGGSNKIVYEHEYTVESVDAAGNITIRNPWGKTSVAGDAVITLTPDQFQAYFTGQSIGSI
jgi:hypothetical protein